MLNEETIKRIKQLHQDGVSKSAISRQLGVSLNAVRSHVGSEKRGGRKKVTAADIKKMIKLRKNGLTFKQIGEIVGFSATIAQTHSRPKTKPKSDSPPETKQATTPTPTPESKESVLAWLSKEMATASRGLVIQNDSNHSSR